MLHFTGTAIRHDDRRETVKVEMISNAARPGLHVDGWSPERCAVVAKMVAADRTLTAADRTRFALARVDVIDPGKLVANHAMAAAIARAIG